MGPKTNHVSSPIKGLIEMTEQIVVMFEERDHKNRTPKCQNTTTTEPLMQELGAKFHRNVCPQIGFEG